MENRLSVRPRATEVAFDIGTACTLVRARGYLFQACEAEPARKECTPRSDDRKIAASEDDGKSTGQVAKTGWYASSDPCVSLHQQILLCVCVVEEEVSVS